MAKDTKSPFLLSYHDVSSANWQKVREELEILEKWGFPQWSLLIIPNCPSDKLPDFQTALRDFRDKGHELSLHGFEHRANPSLKRSLSGKIALKLTAGEAEFAGLNRRQSKILLEEAIRAWDRLGMGRAEGFVAPTWHAPEHLAEMALAVGWTFYEDRFSVHFQFGSNRNLQGSIPVSIAGIPGICISLVLALGKSIVPLLPGVPRLVLHPGEVSGKNGIRIRRLLEGWAKWGSPTTYADLSQKRQTNAQ